MALLGGIQLSKLSPKSPWLQFFCIKSSIPKKPIISSRQILLLKQRIFHNNFPASPKLFCGIHISLCPSWMLIFFQEYYSRWTPRPAEGIPDNAHIRGPSLGCPKLRAPLLWLLTFVLSLPSTSLPLIGFSVQLLMVHWLLIETLRLRIAKTRKCTRDGFRSREQLRYQIRHIPK